MDKDIKALLEEFGATEETIEELSNGKGDENE